MNNNKHTILSLMTSHKNEFLDFIKTTKDDEIVLEYQAPCSDEKELIFKGTKKQLITELKQPMYKLTLKEKAEISSLSLFYLRALTLFESIF